MPIDVSGKVVVVTGALTGLTREQATDQLEALGAQVAKSVTKKTDILFCGARAGSKLEKAESLGIEILGEAELKALLSDEAAASRASAKPAVTDVEVKTEIADGETVYVQGSAAKPYELRNTGGVYSCSCPAWRNQSAPIDLRSCKHIASVRGAAAETARVGRSVASVKASKTSSPKLLLAQKWEPHVDPTGWWMSEKLDGVRAFWTGEQFVSRLGNVYHAPDWFVADFPSVPLDGELWIGRGLFQRSVSVARRQDKGDHWKEIRFVMFDAPDAPGAFEERLKYMHSEFSSELTYASVLDHVECKGHTALEEELRRVEALSGEGLMLREAGSDYIRGRSTTLLKVKTFHDAEAKVIGYKGGQGRHRNRVGAIELITPEGVRFFAGTGLSDAERENPPEVGALVTYRFQELTDQGVPRFPTYVGVRTDGTWEGPDVSALLAKEAPKAKVKAKSETSNLAATPAGDVEAPAEGVQRFEHGGTKFWEISVDGDSHTVRYGKLGANGATKTKSFASAEAAQSDADKLIKKKTSKGYAPA